MKKYEQSAVEFLQSQNEITDVHGAKVVIKASPYEKRGGYLDPLVFEGMKKHWVGREESDEPKKELSPEEALQAMRDNMGFPNLNLNDVEIHTKYENINFDGNNVGMWRYYTRKSMRKTDRPCFVFLHGGGWVGGTTYTVENPCKLIAQLADAVVFNIDYALAPEKKFPNGFNDCFNAVKHIYDHAEEYGIDKNKIALGGDSAGGNLTAAVSMKSRDLGINMVALQVLMYPCVTFINHGIEGYKWDIGEFEIADEQKDFIPNLLGIGRPTSEENELMMNGMYITNIEGAYHPYVSPMLAHSKKNLPRALCVSAEFDGLRLQTEHYGKLMAEEGVEVKTIRYKGMPHAFIDQLGYLPQAEDLCIEIAKAMELM